LIFTNGLDTIETPQKPFKIPP